MNKFERENIRNNNINVVKRSWAYERLTEKEQNKIIEILSNCQLFGNNAKQVYEQLNTIYKTFLTALDYTWNGWRENKQKEVKQNETHN